LRRSQVSTICLKQRAAIARRFPGAVPGRQAAASGVTEGAIMRNRGIGSSGDGEQLQRAGGVGRRRGVRAAAVVAAGLLVFVVVGLHGGGTWSRTRGQAAAKSAAPLPAVVVTPALTATVPLYEEAVAQTVALEMITLRPQVAGTIEQLLFKEGTFVKRGQTLAVLDQRPYIAALESAEAQLANAQAALQQALQQVQLRQAQQQLAALQATLAFDHITVRRDRYLVAQGAIAQAQMDNDTATMNAQAANVAAQEAVVKDTGLSTQIGIAQAQATVRQMQANVRQAQVNVVDTTVPSPVDGIISLRSVDQGNYVQVNQQLATVATIDPIIAQFPLSEVVYLNLAQQTKQGTPERGVAAAEDPEFQMLLPNGTLYRYPGTFRTVDNSVNPQSGTIQAQALFPNPQHLLRPGVYARVRVRTQERPHTVLVPQQAVATVQGTETVYVVGPNNTVSLRAVTDAGPYGPFFTLLSGVAAGERVIVQGVQKVRPGARVRPTMQPAPPLPTGASAPSDGAPGTGRSPSP
jgi:membrane fusion protein, multidrug efflux system